ncbi:MAG: peptide chain release factor 1 [Armatimonadetes bacterium]|nr:peptide chain release factor 1 [Armatimonadota bacterium]
MKAEKLEQKLRETVDRFYAIEKELGTPEVATNPAELQRLGKLHSELAPIVQKFSEYQTAQKSIEEAKALVESGSDPDLTALAEEELERLAPRAEELMRELQLMLLPKDPNDDKNVLIEIRAGTGGEEAGIFAGDLLRMYMRYAERRGWKPEVLEAVASDLNGFKEVILGVAGQGAYSELKHESGVHRVQRVPATESSGRIHTSAATVAVLPEAEEVDVTIHPDDLEIDTYRSSGAGGQSVQKNETAIRILHKPTGLVVTCQDERSQLQNRERAMRMLRSRLYEMQQRQQQEERAASRKSQVGSGDRSEKIRTYNFPDRRVTDHRVGVTLHDLDGVMDGAIQPLLDALRQDEQAKRLDEIA